MKLVGNILIAPLYIIIALLLGIIISVSIYVKIYCILCILGYRKLKEVFTNEDC